MFVYDTSNARTLHELEALRTHFFTQVGITGAKAASFPCVLVGMKCDVPRSATRCSEALRA